jgi:serine/threonine-protein kinase
MGEQNLRRFEREAQLTARLTNPHTVSVYDFGRTPEGAFYYVMEFLDGIDLERLVREGGPLPPGRAVHVLLQVCEALAEAHGVGLVHRDIKPANILLSELGGIADFAKVLDFVTAIEPHEGSRVVAVLKSGARIVASRPGTARLKARI